MDNIKRDDNGGSISGANGIVDSVNGGGGSSRKSGVVGGNGGSGGGDGGVGCDSGDCRDGGVGGCGNGCGCGIRKTILELELIRCLSKSKATFLYSRKKDVKNINVF